MFQTACTGPQKDDIIWILKDLTPLAKWLLKRVVVGTSTGNNKTIRVAKVKATYGTYVCPVTGIARDLADEPLFPFSLAAIQATPTTFCSTSDFLFCPPYDIGI